MPIERINPDDIYEPFNNRYTQVISVTGSRQVHVAGMLSLDKDKQLIGEGDMQTQTRVTLENIRKALAAADATPADVVRINMFVTDVEDYREVGHPELAKFFGDTLPVSTLVEVSRLAAPGFLIEIQMTAIVD